MEKIFNRLLVSLCAIALILGFAPPAQAAPDLAEDISATTQFSGSGYASFSFLTDGDVKKYQTSTGNTEITLKNPDGMGGLYLLFDLEYGKYTITDNVTGKTVTTGTYGMLHEYIPLENPTTSLTIRFDSGAVRLSELYVFSQGKAPDFVQVWNAPLEGKADLVLFATHGDDDQLFFAGLLPYYAKEVGCGVQVVYMTDHRNLTNARVHEMLNGLWSVGVTAYPVFGSFDDFRIDDKEETYHYYAKLGTTKEELQGFVVEQIRRFKPQVAVGHDPEGEYGHGMHLVYSELLTEGVVLAASKESFPESAQKYGTWQTKKTYLHLYEENQITLDLDSPLTSFNGMTAFQVTQKLGYPCHDSQQYTWFTKWINWVGMNVGGTPITKATQIEKFSPCKYGLYQSVVGADVEKNDFLENIVTYAQQERLEQERLEQERLEQERLEQERLEQERLEQERLEQERLEQERLELERLAQQKKKDLQTAIIFLAVLVAVLVATLVLARIQARRRRKKRRCQRRNKNMP